MNLLFFEPIGRKAIWGQNAVKDYFEYEQLEEGVGQAWAFSAQVKASNLCLSEPYKGKTLREIWKEHPELFDHHGEEFPLIISLVGPVDDLSIQVHPDKEQAAKIGFPEGKNEAWYFIEAPAGSSIVYGHNAKDEEDLKQYITNERWEDLIRHLEIHPGDFVYLPAGILHAMQKGVIAYEIQQATDITYRFYDYHRKDKEGNERELHVKQAIDCLSYDPAMMKNDIHPVETEDIHKKETVFIANDSFTVTRLEIDGFAKVLYDKYQLATVITGNGKAEGIEIKVGDNFLIPAHMPVAFDGNMTIMMTTK